MTRRLTTDEHELWTRLRQTVKPLRHSHKAQSETAAPSPAKPKPRHKADAPKTSSAAPTAKPGKTPPLAPLEEKTRRRLARGAVEIEARIDLHGMRQERAFSALSAFLRSQQASGARIVLVVTGKGREGSEGRGVLRESVPHWLAGGELRPFVVGFEEAHRRHGGGGALYVRIRRRRAAGRSPAD